MRCCLSEYGLLNHLETESVSHSHLSDSLCYPSSASGLQSFYEGSHRLPTQTTGKRILCALPIRCCYKEMLTASNSMMTMNSCHVRRSTTCSGINAPLIRPRPALKLLTVLNQREGRVPSHSQRPLVFCQHSRLSETRKTLHTPEVCFEEVQKPLPPWQRLASFLLKSTAMVALALALVSCQGQSNHVADRARSSCARNCAAADFRWSIIS